MPRLLRTRIARQTFRERRDSGTLTSQEIHATTGQVPQSTTPTTSGVGTTPVFNPGVRQPSANQPIPGLQTGEVLGRNFVDEARKSFENDKEGFKPKSTSFADQVTDLDQSTNDVLDEVGRQAVGQTSQLAGLLEAQQERNEAFEQSLQAQQTDLGNLFSEITKGLAERGNTADTETDRANAAAAKLTSLTTQAQTGINPNLGQGFSRGRTTATAGLTSKNNGAGSNRRQSFQSTRP